MLFLTSGRRTPTTRYRILPFLPHLRRSGFSCDVAHSFPEKYDSFRWLGWRGSRWLKHVVRRGQLRRAAGAFEVVVLERELFDEPGWEPERELRRIAPRLVLDIDDAIFLRYPEKFRELTSMSDAILAGNPNLVAKCREHNPAVHLLPTAIELADYPLYVERNPTAANKPVVGWIGTPSGLEYLKQIAPALREVAQECRVRVICDAARAQASLASLGLEVETRQWNPRTAHTELSQFDIGVMPLPDGEWERFKCGFKLLQYMACGVASVASPVGVNAQIVSHGTNGMLAATTEDWIASLRELIRHPELRNQLGAAARETILRHYTVEQHVPTMVRALTGGA